MREKPKAAACWRTIAALLCQPGSPIPNDNGLLVRDRVPLSQVLQKINGVVTVASTLMPDETLTMAKITSPYRLSRFLREEKCWAPNRVPLRLANGSLLHILMKVGFIHINQACFTLTQLPKPVLKTGYKLGALGGVGFD